MPFTVVITGANGEVGRRTVLEALKDGHTVIGLDQAAEAVPGSDEHGPADEKLLKRFTYKQVDLTDRDAFLDASKGSDAMIHLAAIFRKDDNPDADKIPDHVCARLPWSDAASER